MRLVTSIEIWEPLIFLSIISFIIEVTALFGAEAWFTIRTWLCIANNVSGTDRKRDEACFRVNIFGVWFYLWLLRYWGQNDNFDNSHLFLSPIQNVPPLAGDGLLHSRNCIEIPPPHDREQVLQSLQLPQPPLTGVFSSIGTHFPFWHH